ncbi:uncharacterized protein LOC129728854 [Wyeomyia smithii]|uniref:uncharacterized protein LOC129728854 n=1 Tax=Wyeomyia smithii TaxID=174621 RepID=UPI002467B21A|nr:uncharacterized protein LOC129728854 [Wyeomyia smithii]
MDKNCYECSQPITNLNLIKCHLCDSVAHMKCFGWARSNLDFVNGQPNLLWFCADCLKSIENLKTKHSSDTAIDTTSAFANSITCCMNEVKKELGQINAFIGSISDKLLTNTTPVMLSANRSSKRPRVISPSDTPKRPRGFSGLLSGTKAVENFPSLVETVPQPTTKFWIYLSRIAPHVSEDEIAALVRDCVSDIQPVVKKLVRKDADVKSLAFISFKVGIDLQLKDAALDANNWPKGIYFRQFEERNASSDFWKPKASKFPRTVPSQPATSPHLVPLN